MKANEYIAELRDAIRRLHGVESEHVRSVPVKETFQGQTIWDGIVEVFHLNGHPKTSMIYAWSHATDDPENPLRHITVLHIAPVLSPAMAVRAAIREEFRSDQPEEA
jgi:hypothetical protein